MVNWHALKRAAVILDSAHQPHSTTASAAPVSTGKKKSVLKRFQANKPLDRIAFSKSEFMLAREQRFDMAPKTENMIP